MSDRGQRTPVVAGIRSDAFVADGHQQVAISSELVNDVVSLICAVNLVIRSYRDAVSARCEKVFSPGADKTAVALVDHQPGLAAVDDVNAVVGIDGNATDILVCVASRQLLPAFNDLETQTIGIRHDQSSPCGNRQIASFQEISLRTNFCSVWQSVGTIPNLPAKL